MISLSANSVYAHRCSWRLVVQISLELLSDSYIDYSESPTLASLLFSFRKSLTKCQNGKSPSLKLQCLNCCEMFSDTDKYSARAAFFIYKAIPTRHTAFGFWSSAAAKYSVKVSLSNTSHCSRRSAATETCQDGEGYRELSSQLGLGTQLRDF